MSQPGARSGHGAGISALVVLAVVLLVGGYVAAAFLTRDRWTGGSSPEDRTSAVFSAVAPNGSAPSPVDLGRTREVLEDRIAELGGGEVSIADAADAASVTVTVPGADEADLQALGQSGRLYLRPVIHAIPAEPPAPSPKTRSGSSAQQISDERMLRQSTDQSVQVLALQFQATRCDGEDALAGNDDPDLPLVTCSQDGTVVYLLDKSFIDGDEVRDAAAQADEVSGQFVVDMTFTEEAATRWADFTEANVGTQTAFTLDTTVVSAPEIREAITGGRMQIAGNFDESDAEALASVLGHGILPVNLTFESSTIGPGAASAPSTPLRVALAAAGLLVLLFVAGSVVYLIAAARTRGRT